MQKLESSAFFVPLSELLGGYSYAFRRHRKINEKFLPLFQTFPDKGSLYLQ